MTKENSLKYRNSFKLFNEEVLGFKFPDFLYKALFDWIVSGKKFAAIEAPRGHGKTQFFTRNYVSWRAFRESNIKIAISSSSMPQTIDFMTDIKEFYENKELLQELVPTDKSKAWASQKLFFNNGAKIFAKPFGPGARGTHVNLLVLDDILRDLEVSIEKAKDVFWDILFPTVQTLNGDLLLVGTPMDDKDLFFDIENRIIEDKEFAKDWFFSKNPAVKLDDLDNWIEPLWSERYDLDRLKSIQNNMSKPKFSREYLLTPSSFESSFYDKADFVNSLSLNHALEYEPLDGALHYLGCDFAMSTKARADYSAFITVAVLPGKVEVEFAKDRKEIIQDPIFIRNVFWGKGISYDNQMMTIKDIFRKFNISQAVIDKTNFGFKFYEDLKMNYNIEGQDFPLAKRNALLTNLRVILEKGRLVIPFKDKDNTRNIILELKNQLKGFTTDKNSTSILSKAKHDDLVIALAMAVKNLDKQKFYSNTEQIIVSNNSVNKKDELDDKDRIIFSA